MGEISDAEPGAILSLGVISEDGPGHRFDLAVPLNEEEFRRYNEALTRVMNLTRWFAFEVVERNTIDLMNLCAYTGIALTLPRDFATTERANTAVLVMSKVVDWLGALRLFLDHTETSLTRRFGATSDQVKQFKAATASAFDGSFEYRFSYHLRNYVQHCGAPPLSMHMGAPRPGGVFPVVDYRFDPEQLLAAYKKWGAIVTRDLRDRDGHISLQDVIDGTMAQVRLIAAAARDVDVADGVAAAEVLREGVDRLRAIHGDQQPYLIVYAPADPENQRVNVHLSEIPASAVDRLCRVGAGQLSKEELFGKPTAPTFDVDPSSIGQRLRTDSRGVQVMAAFVAQDRKPGSVVATVNEIIKQDGGIQQLVDGLINVAAVLLYMTAGSIGAQPRGLLQGLIDHYVPRGAVDGATADVPQSQAAVPDDEGQQKQ